MTTQTFVLPQAVLRFLIWLNSKYLYFFSSTGPRKSRIFKENQLATEYLLSIYPIIDRIAEGTSRGASLSLTFQGCLRWTVPREQQRGRTDKNRRMLPASLPRWANPRYLCGRVR